MIDWLTTKSSDMLATRTSRRGFLSRVVLVAAALVVAPLRFLLRPGSAYAAICSCNGSSCNCTDLCCDGYTEFCCTITGSNSCPPGTVAAGWWKADGSGFCDTDGVPKPRYYLDCNAGCNGCGCGSNGLCSRTCSDYDCGCADGNCSNRKAGCTSFRYGQCNNQITCVGPIVCRVVTCIAPWEFEPTCSTASATDNFTRFHNRPCLQGVDGIQALPGAVRGTTWYLSENPNGGPADIVFDYGQEGDVFVMGDWNGDGTRTPGVVRGVKYGPFAGKLLWLLRNDLSGGEPDIVIEFGDAGGFPVVGDWDGNGVDGIGVLRNGVWELRNSPSSGPADSEFVFGQPGDHPIAGDWNGNGADSIGVKRGNQYRLRNTNDAGLATTVVTYAEPDDTIVIGDWNKDGVDTIGVVRGNQWLLRNSNTAGNSSVNFRFGSDGDIPVVWGRTS